MSPDRAEQIAGLLELAAWLEAHPDVPVSNIQAVVFPDGSDEEKRAQVDTMANQLGVEPRIRAGGEHYIASRDFGGEVTFEALAITRAHMARYRAEITYAGAVEPDDEQAVA